MITKRVKHITLFLLYLYLGYFAGISLFVHSHIYNGVVYIHSHPFQDSNTDTKTPYQTHEHTGASFFALNQLSNATSDEAIIYSFEQVLAFFVFEIRQFYVGETSMFELCEIQKLRAPPILS